MRKLKITEEQYQKAIAEGIQLYANVDAENGNVAQAVDKTRQDAQRSGLDPKEVDVVIPSESKVIGANQLMEARRRYLEKNSTLYSAEDFFKTIRKK